MWDEAQALSQLSDTELDQSAIRAAASERKCMHTVLLHIREIERRRLYAKLECGAIYEYVVKRLKYSEGSASRRIAAARMLSDNPEITTSVQSGALNLGDRLEMHAKVSSSDRSHSSDQQRRYQRTRQRPIRPRAPPGTRFAHLKRALGKCGLSAREFSL